VRVRPVAVMALTIGAALQVSGCHRAPSGESPHTGAAPTAQPPATTWPAAFHDAEGEQVTLAAPPRRIVSLSPAITEILFAIGVGDRVVGVTSYCDYPPEATKLPKVGAYTGFSVEKVLDLQPDVALGMRGTSKEAIQALRRAGVSVLMYDPISVTDVLDLMQELARMTQTQLGEVTAVAQLRARVQTVQAQAAKLPRRPRALCAVQVEPLYAAGPKNHVDDMIRLAGAENAAGDADTAWPQYSLERMLEKDPEVIVVPLGTMGGAGEPAGGTAKVLKASKAWAGTTAVRRGAIAEIPDDLLTLPGPRIVDGLETMAAAVRKAAFPDAESGENAGRGG